MKYLITLLIFFNLSIYAQFAGGSGTALDPYQIATPTQLDSVRNHKHSYFKLINDIDFTGYSLSPIDTLYGQLDGGGYKIKNLTTTTNVSASNYASSLFLFLSGAYIHHLVLDSINLRITGNANPDYLGIIGGYVLSNTTVDSVIISNANIKFINTNHADWGIGGFIGRSTLAPTTLTRCALINSVIDDSCRSNPDGYWGSAGFIASSNNCSASKCYVLNSTIKAWNYLDFGQLNAAGIFGYPFSCTITDCYVNAKFYTNNDASFGFIEGLTGYTSSSNNITRSYVVDSLISLLPSANKFTFTSNSGITSNSMNYADTTISQPLGFVKMPTDTGYHYTNTIAMKTQSTYSGWDFVNTWGINSTLNNGYPYLKWSFIPTVLSPTSGYYYKDSTISVITNADTSETDSVYISYGYDYHYKTILSHDTANIILDSLSSNAKIKLVNTLTGVTVYSQSFNIVAYKTLSIQSVYITSSQTPIINVVALTSGVSSVNAYYSADTVGFGWTYYGTFSISSLLPQIDTLSKSVNFAVRGSNSFYKLVEVKDTAVYNLSMQIITNFGFFVNPQICMSFAFYDDAVTGFPGGNDIKDIGCGWVGNITKYYGRVTTTVNTDGTVTVNSNETAYPYPYTNMPALTTVNLFQSCTVTNPFIYNGREYWVVTTSTSWYPSYDLWMKDLINNVSYPVLHLGSGGAGIVANWAGAQAQEFYGDIGVFRSGDGLSAVSAKLLSYPSSGLPLSSVYNLTGGINYAYFRNYLRGIYPKAPIDQTGGK